MITTLFYLFVGHAVADYALQSPWVASGKNRHIIPDGYDPKAHGPRQPVWILVLTAHALIHAGAVAIVTREPFLAFWQFWTHWLIDFFKCEKQYNVWVDQGLHAAVLIFTAIYWSLL